MNAENIKKYLFNAVASSMAFGVVFGSMYLINPKPFTPTSEKNVDKFQIQENTYQGKKIFTVNGKEGKISYIQSDSANYVLLNDYIDAQKRLAGKEYRSKKDSIENSLESIRNYKLASLDSLANNN